MLTIGYDKVVDGRPTSTNAFKSVDGKVPINLGFAGYDLPRDIQDGDDEILDVNIKYKKYPVRLTTYGDWMSSYHDIELKQIDQIEGKYYYLIDVYPYEFWSNPESRYPNKINLQAIEDIKNGKAKILVLFIAEPLLLRNCQVTEILNTWAANFNLPNRSIILSSGNCIYGEFLKRDKAIVYIPFTCWEVTHRHKCSNKLISSRTNNIINRKKRKKIFLCYNRRNKSHRMKLVHALYKFDLLKFGFISLGNHHMYTHSHGFDEEFINMLPMKFDGTDLKTNQASSFIEYDYAESYFSIVTESFNESNVVFFSEKIFKPIVAMQPFIIVTSPGALRELKKLGYQTFSQWIDESYDEELDNNKRLKMIVQQIQKLTTKSEEYLQNMLIEMLPVLKHNIDTLLKRTEDGEFFKQLEEELWK